MLSSSYKKAPYNSRTSRLTVILVLTVASSPSILLIRYYYYYYSVLLSRTYFCRCSYLPMCVLLAEVTTTENHNNTS
ncbi:hypothetical protein P175DRAFT_0184274 [Aspergillus ochraceoroseus IBT 24754]|uniref:Uncharacterized protein n=1 Tax=Aspergillus ochraceoroseus IBT 24754 TaxID=1392256 RepID=A0A2T5LYN0_9EURO|nr:uncharacterized protein P175DRAFT_0184274 [Aspergillus ochraceoroseus IBT 24754]PTU21394.1 hypothetical protein P175DRAFT_0184274 [Aspergillus ochraceoroseus IBT 24754]